MPEADEHLYKIERFDKGRHDRSQFEGTVQRYTDYLTSKLNQHASKGYCAAYVAVEVGENAVVAYMTLSMSSIRPEDLDEMAKKDLGLPPLHIPTVHVGMMGTDRRHVGQGLGTSMLTKAGLVGLAAREIGVGCWGVSLDADEANADQLVPYYSKRNFVRLSMESYRMALPLSTFEKALQN